MSEFLERGGLDTVLRNVEIDLPYKTRIQMAIDANRGMLFMHEKGKIHRDLKSLNLLVLHVHSKMTFDRYPRISGSR